MILKFLIVFIPAIYVLGQNCKFSTEISGYCREKGDCFGPFKKNDCKNNLICCKLSNKSEQKCRDYGIYVYKRNYNSALSVRTNSYNSSECNIEATPLVVGGLKTKPKEFPHMVAIGYGKNFEKAEWMCGGSLISENFVLSAAHCSQSEGRGPAKFARLGTTYIRPPIGSSHQDVAIKKRINHPKYKPSSPYNDIALFQLSHPVKLNGFVRPACLHTDPDEFIFRKAMATGWGKVDFDAEEGSKDLLKVTLSFISYSRCNQLYSNSLERGIITSQICAGNLEGGKDTCQGDSGGPLQIVKRDPYCMYSIVGITSFGKFCGFKNSPAVYTRVSYFVPWIESIVWPEHSNTTNFNMSTY